MVVTLYPDRYPRLNTRALKRRYTNPWCTHMKNTGHDSGNSLWLSDYLKRGCLEPKLIYIKSFLEYRVIPWCHGLWSGVFCLGHSMRFAELEFSVEYSLVRPPPSGGGSNAPRPAVSVPHIDVNADECRARRASVEEEFWKNCWILMAATPEWFTKLASFPNGTW